MKREGVKEKTIKEEELVLKNKRKAGLYRKRRERKQEGIQSDKMKRRSITLKRWKEGRILYYMHRMEGMKTVCNAKEDKGKKGG